jgi:hypothetical protein
MSQFKGVARSSRLNDAIAPETVIPVAAAMRLPLRIFAKTDIHRQSELVALLRQVE